MQPAMVTAAVMLILLGSLAALFGQRAPAGEASVASVARMLASGSWASGLARAGDWPETLRCDASDRCHSIPL